MATNMEKAAKMTIDERIEQIANSWATNTGSKEHLKADLRELCEAVQAKAVADAILRLNQYERAGSLPVDTTKIRGF